MTVKHWHRADALSTPDELPPDLHLLVRVSNVPELGLTNVTFGEVTSPQMREVLDRCVITFGPEGRPGMLQIVHPVYSASAAWRHALDCLVGRSVASQIQHIVDNPAEPVETFEVHIAAAEAAALDAVWHTLLLGRGVPEPRSVADAPNWGAVPGVVAGARPASARERLKQKACRVCLVPPGFAEHAGIGPEVVVSSEHGVLTMEGWRAEDGADLRVGVAEPLRTRRRDAERADARWSASFRVGRDFDQDELDRLLVTLEAM